MGLIKRKSFDLLIEFENRERRDGSIILKRSSRGYKLFLPVPPRRERSLTYKYIPGLKLSSRFIIVFRRYFQGLNCSQPA
jgi:hypothetical protein